MEAFGDLGKVTEKVEVRTRRKDNVNLSARHKLKEAKQDLLLVGGLTPTKRTTRAGVSFLNMTGLAG